MKIRRKEGKNEDKKKGRKGRMKIRGNEGKNEDKKTGRKEGRKEGR